MSDGARIDHSPQQAHERLVRDLGILEEKNREAAEILSDPSKPYFSSAFWFPVDAGRWREAWLVSILLLSLGGGALTVMVLQSQQSLAIQRQSYETSLEALDESKRELMRRQKQAACLQVRLTRWEPAAPLLPADVDLSNVPGVGLRPHWAGLEHPPMEPNRCGVHGSHPLGVLQHELLFKVGLAACWVHQGDLAPLVQGELRSLIIALERRSPGALSTLARGKIRAALVVLQQYCQGRVKQPERVLVE